VIVHQESRFKAFADLRGATWAYNEPHSHSGYNLTRYYLATLGETGGYFGAVVEAGVHQAALEMVLDGRVDASAIDSTVLEMETALRPEIKGQIRVVATLGPSPIPPLVISRSLPPELRQAIRTVLLQMHTVEEGRAILIKGQIDHFVRVDDRDYDPIREMAREAEQVRLVHSTFRE
jgi:phosphonate transport system substrate-binding protein